MAAAVITVDLDARIATVEDGLNRAAGALR